MRLSNRRHPAALITGLAAGLVAVLGTALLPTPAGAAPRRAAPAVLARGGSVKPGFAGAPIVLQDFGGYTGYDIASDQASGTAYVGWVGQAQGQLRSVHLCVLPVGATACAGGVLTTTPGGDGGSAAGLHVIVTSPGVAQLTWFYQGTDGGHLAQATYAGGVLSATATVAAAPSNGELLDVAKAPSGQVYSVVRGAATSGAQTLEVRLGATQPVATITAPWDVTRAELAFDGANPVLVTDHEGAVEEPVYWTAGPTWAPLAPVAKTWTIDNFVEDAVTTKYGVRLIASEAKSSYHPVVSSFKGGKFGKPVLTGDDNNCNPLSHDLVSDGSGRGADVAEECSDLMISNLADGEHAGTVKVPAGGIVASGTPQISTTTRGTGWVVWSVQDATPGNQLRVAPILLPALMTEKGRGGPGGTVRVEGPASCLPVVTAKAKVKATPHKGWHLASSTLTVNGKGHGHSTKLHGEKADPGEKFTLSGTATFRKGNATSTVDAPNLKVTAC